MSHTYAILQVSQATYDEIRTRLEMAGYQDQFHDDEPGGPAIDMHGIALQVHPLHRIP